MRRKQEPGQRTCKHCGGVFQPKRSDQIYCSRTCCNAAAHGREKGKHPMRICPVCGTQFEGTRNRHYCCVECASEGIRRRRQEQARNTKVRICKKCGEPFRSANVTRIYCTACSPIGKSVESEYLESVDQRIARPLRKMELEYVAEFVYVRTDKQMDMRQAAIDLGWNRNRKEYAAFCTKLEEQKDELEEAIAKYRELRKKRAVRCSNTKSAPKSNITYSIPQAKGV